MDVFGRSFLNFGQGNVCYFTEFGGTIFLVNSLQTGCFKVFQEVVDILGDGVYLALAVVCVMFKSCIPKRRAVGHCSCKINGAGGNLGGQVLHKFDIHEAHLAEIFTKGVHRVLRVSGLGESPQEVKRGRRREIKVQGGKNLVFAIEDVVFGVGTIGNVYEVIHFWCVNFFVLRCNKLKGKQL